MVQFFYELRDHGHWDMLLLFLDSDVVTPEGSRDAELFSVICSPRRDRAVRPPEWASGSALDYDPTRLFLDPAIFR
ncbi:MAG: hypothetical protein DMG70_22385 [Acidobacteria bacterium]|nr:MAG: hypothetical protein DMG70_22385 [Acidobacteriota bacterium]